MGRILLWQHVEYSLAAQLREQLTMEEFKRKTSCCADDKNNTREGWGIEIHALILVPGVGIGPQLTAVLARVELVVREVNK